MNIPLDSRLGCIAEAIGSACIVADIGTDHGLLPIALLLRGQAERAVACDIRQGPLDSARRNAERYGVSDKVELVLTDGFHGIEVYSPDAVVISGMGGELIARIISEAPYLRGDVRLFLQPMTRAESLRRYLAQNGFSIAAEHLARDGKRLYSVIEAGYAGKTAEYTEAQLLVGMPEHHTDMSLFADHAAMAAERLERRRDGLARSVMQSDAPDVDMDDAELSHSVRCRTYTDKTDILTQLSDTISELRAMTAAARCDDPADTEHKKG